MNAEERAELTRDVAHIVAEALSPAMNTVTRGFEKIVLFQERQEKLFERMVSLEERQETLLEQMTEALGLVIARLRRS